MALQVPLPNSAQNVHFDCNPAIFLALSVAEQKLQHHIALVNVVVAETHNTAWPSNFLL